MPGRNINIFFRGGVSRARGAGDIDPNRPYDLRNCRIEHGVVKALRYGEQADASIDPGANNKPWTRWNDSWITGHDDAVQSYGRLYTVELGSKKTSDGGAITSSDSTLTINTTTDPDWEGFDSDDVGANVVVSGAGTSGKDFGATISSITDANTVELSTNAATTVSGADVTIDKCGSFDKRSRNGDLTTEGPYIVGAKVINWVNPDGSGDRNGITNGKHVQYLLIPTNKDGEAGEWRYTYWLNDIGQDMGITMEIIASPDTEKVLVYRTVERNDDGSAYDPSPPANLPQDANLLYYVGLAQPNEVFKVYTTHHRTGCTEADAASDNELFLVNTPVLGLAVNDTLQFVTGSEAPGTVDITSVNTPDASCPSVTVNVSVDGGNFAYYGSPGAGSLATFVSAGQLGSGYDSDDWVELNVQYASTPAAHSRFVFNDDREWNLDTVEISTSSNPSLSGEGVYVSNIHVHDEANDFGSNDHVTPDDRLFSGFGARTAYQDGQVSLFGNVKWSTELPNVGFLKTGASGHDLRIRYEYQDEEGNSVYGPKLDIDSVEYLEVAPGRNEIAVVIFKEFTLGAYYIYERLTLNALGRYSSSIGDDDSQVTFDSDNYDAEYWDYLGITDTQHPEVGCIQEKNVILMSRAEHPYEALFQAANVNLDEEILSIQGARVLEEDALTNYTFYVLTDRRVYVATRSGFSISLEPVTNNVGVSLGNDSQPLDTPTNQGLVFYGTDGHLYFVTGRTITPIDADIVETDGRHAFEDLYSTVYDLTFHVNFGEVWLATDTGVWCLGLERDKGVVAHYQIEPLETNRTKRLHYEQTVSGGTMLFGDHNDDQQAGGVQNMTLNTPGQSSDLYLNTPYVETHDMLDITERSRIDRAEVLFTPMPPGQNVNNLGQTGWVTGTLVFDVRSFTGGSPKTATITGVEPSIPKYPRFRGVAHRVRFETFEELREITLSVTGSPGNN